MSIPQLRNYIRNNTTPLFEFDKATLEFKTTSIYQSFNLLEKMGTQCLKPMRWVFDKIDKPHQHFLVTILLRVVGVFTAIFAGIGFLLKTTGERTNPKSAFYHQAIQLRQGLERTQLEPHIDKLLKEIHECSDLVYPKPKWGHVSNPKILPSTLPFKEKAYAIHKVSAISYFDLDMGYLLALPLFTDFLPMEMASPTEESKPIIANIGKLVAAIHLLQKKDVTLSDLKLELEALNQQVLELEVFIRETAYLSIGYALTSLNKNWDQYQEMIVKFNKYPEREASSFQACREELRLLSLLASYDKATIVSVTHELSSYYQKLQNLSHALTEQDRAKTESCIDEIKKNPYHFERHIFQQITKFDPTKSTQELNETLKICLNKNCKNEELNQTPGLLEKLLSYKPQSLATYLKDTISKPLPIQAEIMTAQKAISRVVYTAYEAQLLLKSADAYSTALASLKA